MPDTETSPAQGAPPRARVHLRARDWARTRPTTHLVLKAIVLALGLTLVVAGAAMLVLPGPGWAAIILGLMVLASEYVWAKRLLDPLRRLANRGISAIRARRHR